MIRKILGTRNLVIEIANHLQHEAYIEVDVTEGRLGRSFWLYSLIVFTVDACLSINSRARDCSS